MFRIYAITDIGNIRKENQDGYFINGCSAESIEYKEYYDTSDSVVAVVLDGVGGSDNGSYAVIKSNEFFKTNKISMDKESILRYINDLNEFVNKESLKANINTAAAIVGLIGNDNIKLVFNVGDSSAFIVNKGFLEKVSTDDTEYALMFGYNFENTDIKSPIIQFIGGGLSSIEPHIRTVKSDYIILCSDGLTDLVSIDDIEKIIADEVSIENIGNRLLNKAKSNGGYDNITIVIIKEN